MSILAEYVSVHHEIEKIIDQWWDGQLEMNVALSEIKEVLDLARPSLEF